MTLYLRYVVSLVVLVLLSSGFISLLAQPLPLRSYSESIPMPQDRITDSYVIYSQLLMGGPIEWRKAPRKQWFLEATTKAMPLDVSCGPVAERPGMNRLPAGPEPRTSVTAPPDRQAEWNEVLADYDRHCHDVIQLEAGMLKVGLPVRLLNDQETQSFRKNSRTPPAEFAEAAGLHRFTQVYFNTRHTLALVEQGMWCGSACGSSRWVVLEKRDGRWAMLPWVSRLVIS